MQQFHFDLGSRIMFPLGAENESIFFPSTLAIHTPSILMQTQSRVLVEELKHRLVATLVFLTHLRVLQVRASSHPAMNLGREGLDVVRDLQVRLERGDILGGLVLGGQHRERHIDILCIIGVNHRRVSLSGRLEELVIGTHR